MQHFLEEILCQLAKTGPWFSDSGKQWDSRGKYVEGSLAREISYSKKFMPQCRKHSPRGYGKVKTQGCIVSLRAGGEHESRIKDWNSCSQPRRVRRAMASRLCSTPLSTPTSPAPPSPVLPLTPQLRLNDAVMLTRSRVPVLSLTGQCHDCDSSGAGN